jgi:hypothetical protein
MMKDLQILILALLMFFSFAGKAQFNINYPSQAEDLNSCFGNGLLRVEIIVLTGTINLTVEIQLPPGISYQSGSVQLQSAQGITGITQIGGNANAPIFQISPNRVNAGDFVVFSIRRDANCTARTHALSGGRFKDIVTVSGSSGIVTDNNQDLNTYNVLFPSFTFTQPTALNNALVGSTYNRSFTITNGAAGVSQNLYLQIISPVGSISLTSLNLNGFGILTPSAVIGDTLFFTITPSMLGADGLFTNGESLVFTENIRILNCNANTSYRVGWGCSSNSAAWCQTILGSGIVNYPTGVGSLSSFTASKAPGFVDMCGTGNNGFINMQASYSWSGSGNNTVASAYNVVLRLGGISQGTSLTTLQIASYSFIGNVNINGNSVPSTFSGGILNIGTANFFSFDPDGPGGLQDIDGDGFFDDLAPGNTVQINFQIQPNCNAPCGQGISTNSGIAGAINYNDICRTAFQSQRINGFSWSQDVMIPNGYAPANIVPGLPFTVRLSSGINGNNNPFNSVNTRWSWYVVLPAGVTVAGNSRWTNGQFPTTIASTAVSFTVSNDTVWIQSQSNTTGFVQIDLVYNCTAGNNALNFTLRYGFVQINNPATSCLCFGRRSCGSLLVQTYCPMPCSSGPVNQVPTMRRTNGCLGWTNANMTSRQSISSISSYDLSKALFLDTIQLSGSAVQSNAATNLGMQLEVLSQGTAYPLLAQSVYVEIWRSGVLLSSGTYNTAFNSGSINGRQRIGWNLNGALPSGGLLQNDSIFTLSRYIVQTNTLPLNDTQSGLAWYLYNTISGNNIRCNEFVPEFYLVGTTSLNGSNTFNTSECSNNSLGGNTNYLARRFNTAGVKYQNEFRPAMYIDSFQVVMPNGYEYVSSTYIYTASFGTAGFSLTLTPSTVNGNVLTFVNPGNWLPFEITVTNTYGTMIPVTVRPTCATNTTETITFRVFVKDYYYAFANAATYPAVHNGNLYGANRPINHSNKGNLSLSNLTGEIQAVAMQEFFDISLSNDGNGVAPFTWLAIPNNSIYNIISLTDLTSSTTLTPISYPGGVWFQLSSAGLNSAQSRNYRLRFSYSNCSPDSIRVLAGWNCTSFPSNPNRYSCQQEQIFLRYNPAASELGINSVSLPVGTVNLCNPGFYEYVVNSVQAGNMYNNRLIIQASNGLFPVYLQAEYPRGSGNWQTLSAIQTGNNYNYNLSSHSAYPLTSGILGTLSAAGNSSLRQIGVRFEMQTDCNFTTNSSFNVFATANSSCGALSIGSNVPFTAPNIRITDIEPEYYTDHIINAATSTNCANRSIDFMTTIVGGVTGSTASIEIVLNNGLRFVSGSLICNSASCVSLSSVTVNASGQQIIRLQIPSGLPNATRLRYSIDVSDTAVPTCGLSQISVRGFDINGPVSCVTEPSGQCNTVQYSTGFNSQNILIEKPIADLRLSSPVVLSGSNYLVNFEVENNGTQATNNPLRVDFYCIDNLGNIIGNPIQTSIINSPIAAGATLAQNVQINAFNCNFFGFAGVLSNVSNCVCDSVGFREFTQLLPVVLISFDASSQINRTVLLEWTTASETNNDFFSIERSGDGIQWQKVLDVKAADESAGVELNYSAIDYNPIGGISYYRLKQTDTDGSFSYSPIRSVQIEADNKFSFYPNPADDFIHIESSSETYSVEILNVFGQSKGIYYNIKTIDTKSLSSGTYFIKISENHKNVFSSKLHIAH